MHVHRGNGLPSDVVYNVYPDREGALWLALDVGVARVDTPSPVSFLDEREGLAGSPFDIIRHDGGLYVAGQTGVQRLTPASGTAGPISSTSRRQPPSAGTSRRCPEAADRDASRWSSPAPMACTSSMVTRLFR